MSVLPVDLIGDILSRLPVKPLLLFRCVSKPWCALIDSPHFLQLHLNRSVETNSNLGFVFEYGGLYSIDLDSLDVAVKLDHPVKSQVYALGSCNGLLCLSDFHNKIVFLLNFSTRKHHKLAVAPIEFPHRPRIEPFILYGFGYDSDGDDYKLVRMLQFYCEGDTFYSQVSVYSLKLNSWRRIQGSPYNLLYRHNKAVFVRGALHWVVRQGEAKLIDAFDLGVEEYRLVPQRDILLDIRVVSFTICGLWKYN